MRKSGIEIIVAAALVSLALAAPSQAKSKDEAAFKLLSASGTQTHTFNEQTTDIEYGDNSGDLTQPPSQTRIDTCTGTQSLSLRYRTTKPTKMYVFLREAHGLHTLISDKPDPDSGLDFLSAPGEMTLSRSVNYVATRDCTFEPADCPETTFPAPVLVFGNHEPTAGISTLYDTNLDLPSSLDRTCEPRPGASFGPLSRYAERPDDPEEFTGAIPRSEIFGKKKRLRGEDSFEFSYETSSGTGNRVQSTVTGTYGETMALELKRLKAKR